jgi:orotate phosphoribosyltransferase-like protein
LDYGNTSTESIENIRKLPEAATTFQLLAKMVALDDVPEVPIKDVKFENK